MQQEAKREGYFSFALHDTIKDWRDAQGITGGGSNTIYAGVWPGWNVHYDLS
jgi:hypothetical protein